MNFLCFVNIFTKMSPFKISIYVVKYKDRGCLMKKEKQYYINYSRSSYKKRDIHFPKRKKRPGFNAKKILLILIVIASIVGCLKLINAYRSNEQAENKIRIEKNNVQVDNKKKTLVIGQKEEAKKIYGVDAQKVWNALNTYDYDNGGKKQVFLTFDDGPSLTNTPSILKTLKENNVKAPFFVIGKSLAINGAADLLKQEYNEGMAIANHSYSHDYNFLYPGRVLNMANYTSDFNKNAQLIKKSLGFNFETRVYRCPGGQISWQKTEPLNEYLIKNNRASIDWNALNADAEGPKKDAEQLYQHAVETSKGKNLVVLLMHDTYGKEETAKALDKIIKYFKSSGYEFKTLY